MSAECPDRGQLQDWLRFALLDLGTASLHLLKDQSTGNGAARLW